MSRAYTNFKVHELKNEELAGMVRRLQNLTEDGYGAIKKNYALFETSYKRILPLSKQEKEWYLYFYTMYELISLYARHEKYDEVVKYAELFYKETALHMDRELPNYPGTDMSFLNTWTYRDIFRAYYYYHQIDDKKMEAFMEIYEAGAIKYGKTYTYYEDEMTLSVLYRDTERAEKAARNFMLYEKGITGCYVCNCTPYLSCLLLLGQERQAEELMLKFIYKKIPKRHLWCYKYCDNGNEMEMYSIVLFRCIWGGNEEAYRYFFDKYWKELPVESHRKPTSGTIGRLLRAAAGVLNYIEDDLQLVEEDINDTDHYTTVGNMEYALMWWCYFTLLDRSGVREVKIKLPGLNTPDVKTEEDIQAADGEESMKGTENASKVSTLSVAEYMEKRADEFGALFSKARARFDYKGLKGTYGSCFLSEN